MRSLLSFLFVLLLVGSVGAEDATRQTVVFELFISEGCSSCPPADVLLDERTEHKWPGDVYALVYHVDYWTGSVGTGLATSRSPNGSVTTQSFYPTAGSIRQSSWWTGEWALSVPTVRKLSDDKAVVAYGVNPIIEGIDRCSGRAHPAVRFDRCLSWREMGDGHCSTITSSELFVSFRLVGRLRERHDLRYRLVSN
ncbi:MAG: hypothetical protein CME19_08180 [Gemmatimonadetes bacterium]|nr:hypothetical protein [Gemmatimonadota bacterium]